VQKPQWNAVTAFVPYILGLKRQSAAWADEKHRPIMRRNGLLIQAPRGEQNQTIPVYENRQPLNDILQQPRFDSNPVIVEINPRGSNASRHIN
jgi:hypothetical protein